MRGLRTCVHAYMRTCVHACLRARVCGNVFATVCTFATRACRMALRSGFTPAALASLPPAPYGQHYTASTIRPTLYMTNTAWPTLYSQHHTANTIWDLQLGPASRQRYTANTTWPNTIWPTLYGQHSTASTIRPTLHGTCSLGQQTASTVRPTLYGQHYLTNTI